MASRNRTSGVDAQFILDYKDAIRRLSLNNGCNEQFISRTRVLPVDKRDSTLVIRARTRSNHLFRLLRCVRCTACKSDVIYRVAGDNHVLIIGSVRVFGFHLSFAAAGKCANELFSRDERHVTRRRTNAPALHVLFTGHCAHYAI